MRFETVSELGACHYETAGLETGQGRDSLWGRLRASGERISAQGAIIFGATIMSEESLHSESFRVERHGDIAVIIPSPEVESMHENLIQQAAQMVLAPLKEDPPSGLVIDLSRVSYFGSVFISFLLRCHMLVKKHGSEVVLAGVSERIRELLNLTALNTLWAIYSTRAEALEALGGSD